MTVATTADTDEAALLPSDAGAAPCPVGRCAELVAGKWTLLVLRELVEGPRYFGELQAALGGISPRTLCDRLKFLGAEGVITRTRIKGLPPRTVYEFTERGMELRPLIDTMRAIGQAWLLDPPVPAVDPDAIDVDCCEQD